MPRLIYSLRVVFACMRKEIQTALAERRSTLMGVFLPMNFLILMSLFAVSGGLAPTAVVMEDTGPYAQQFYNAMAHAHSFRLQTASAQEAQDLIEAGRIVAVVTIPADFDSRLRQNLPVQVNVKVNNLNTDFTNDIRRAVPLSITLFYGKVFPHVVTVTPREHDFYAQDTDYIPYLTVSILVLALTVGGLLQAGVPAAREWENATIKELLLSPASRFAIVVGKMLGALVMGLVSVSLVLAVLLIIGVWPVHWGEVIGFTLLTLLIFIAYGTLLGTLMKQRQAFTLLAFASTLPLFTLSGTFGPISFNPTIIQVIAQLFPPYYAVVLEQHAFHGFDLNTYGVGLNVGILCGYAALLMVLAALVLRRSTVAN
jgi:ABC-type multidrug transport system permease subunit